MKLRNVTRQKVPADGVLIFSFVDMVRVSRR